MSGEYTLTIKVKTNSDNQQDVQIAAIQAFLLTETFTAIKAIEIERSYENEQSC